MTSARDDILRSIRRSLGVSGGEAPRRAAVAERLDKAPAGVIPGLAQGDAAHRLALFKAKLEAAAASVAAVAHASDVPAEIARYLREHNLPATLRRGADRRLANMPWGRTPLEVSEGASQGDDLNAVSMALAGIAETGTLALVSGADNPTTLNFLPDNHIVVVEAGEIVADMESCWERLRARFGKGDMPRVVNLVTGPSRSADIEQTLLLGAHGPRRLHVVVIEDGRT